MSGRVCRPLREHSHISVQEDSFTWLRHPPKISTMLVGLLLPPLHSVHLHVARLCHIQINTTVGICINRVALDYVYTSFRTSKVKKEPSAYVGGEPAVATPCRGAPKPSFSPALAASQPSPNPSLSGLSSASSASQHPTSLKRPAPPPPGRPAAAKARVGKPTSSPAPSQAASSAASSPAPSPAPSQASSERSRTSRPSTTSADSDSGEAGGFLHVTFQLGLGYI